MANECQKVDCRNPAYTQRSIILDSLIGKVELYLCVSCLTDMIRTRMQTQIFMLEKEMHQNQRTNW
jgi:hypothetical protein